MYVGEVSACYITLKRWQASTKAMQTSSDLVRERGQQRTHTVNRIQQKTYQNTESKSHWSCKFSDFSLLLLQGCEKGRKNPPPGQSESEEPENAPLGFHADTLEAIQAQWDPLSAGELLARVGHFLRIISQMMEEIGYMAEVISRGHRTQTEGDATNLMQGTKRPLPAGDRRRGPARGTDTDEGGEECAEELPSSSTA